MAYYVKYNDIDLTDMIKVREVNTTLTPPRENSTINIWERAGEIYNGYRWENREITLVFLLMYSEDEYDNNPLILEQGMADIRNCLNVDRPKALYLGDPNKFIYAVPDGNIEVNELRYNCVEITIKFSCYDPFYYNDTPKMYEGTNRIVAYNEGDVPTDGILTIGIDEDCHFVQLENMANNKKMLIGNFPMVSKPSNADRTNVLTDECLATSGWSTNTTSIDTGRASTGSLGITEAGQGLMCSNFGSKGSTTWHGVSARKNLGTNVQNFEVEAIVFNVSSGQGGDPNKTVDMTDPAVKYSTEQHYSSYQVTEGSRTEQYKVICHALHIRAGATKNSKVLGYLKTGDVINPTEWAGYKGLWGKIGTNPDKWCYCSPEYVQKTVSDTTTVKTVQVVNNVTITKYVKNYYTTSSAEVREQPEKDSRIVCTIPAGEIVRVIDERLWEQNKDNDGNITTSNDEYWYKIETAWNGYWGYVKGNNCAPATNVAIKYPVEPKTSDDKTGVIEVYGYDNNGVQLFKMSMTDENEYYEFNYPRTTIGGKEFLADTSIAPEPNMSSKNSVNNNQLVVTKDYLLSGQYGNWNDFYGIFGIKRENGYWQAWYQKMSHGYVVKQYWSNYQQVTGSPTGNLSYITLYIGTNNDKPSDMSLQRLTVKNLSPQDPVTTNIKKFQAGDVLKIDMYNNRVWLNDKLYNNIEIGSQFFPLEVGENIIRITSDKGTHSSIVFNEKYL